MQTAVGRIALAAMALGLLPAAGAAAGKKKETAAVFAGTWKGSAEFSGGKNKGQSHVWKLTFGEDFSQVSGRAFDKLKMAKLQKLDFSKRTIAFILFYSKGFRGSKSGTIDCRGKFNAAFTKISGTFGNIAGRGDFELFKQGVAPPAKIARKLKGAWQGACTITKGKLTGESGPLDLKLEDGILAKAKARFFPGRFRALRIEPAAWNGETRQVSFVLIYRNGKKIERAAFFTGTFNEDYTELEGTFKSRKAGDGTFKLEKEVQKKVEQKG